MSERTARAHTITGDTLRDAQSQPVEITDCEEGDQVAIHPDPFENADCPEVIHGRVKRAEQHTTKMPGDHSERVTGETLVVEATDGETYRRKGTGQVSKAVERETRAGTQEFNHVIASDSGLERIEGDSA